MIPGSLDPGEALDIRGSLAAAKQWLRRYFWLWIVYQTAKGIATTTLIWMPLLYWLWWG